MTKIATYMSNFCLLAVSILVAEPAFAALTRPQMDFVAAQVQAGDESVLADLEFNGQPIEESDANVAVLLEMLRSGDSRPLTDQNLTYMNRLDSSMDPIYIKYKDHPERRMDSVLCAGLSEGDARKACTAATPAASKSNPIAVKNFLSVCMLRYHHCPEAAKKTK